MVASLCFLGEDGIEREATTPAQRGAPGPGLRPPQHLVSFVAHPTTPRTKPAALQAAPLFITRAENGLLSLLNERVLKGTVVFSTVPGHTGVLDEFLNEEKHLFQTCDPSSDSLNEERSAVKGGIYRNH